MPGSFLPATDEIVLLRSIIDWGEPFEDGFAILSSFSIILAVFLLGLWAGSAAGASFARRVSDPRFALAVCQGLLAVFIAFAAYTIALPGVRFRGTGAARGDAAART